MHNNIESTVHIIRDCTLVTLAITLTFVLTPSYTSVSTFYQFPFIHVPLCAFILLYVVYTLMNPRIIVLSIDGNIGSGKSTLLKKLLLSQQSYFLSPFFLLKSPEPLSEWISTVDSNGENILGKFYKDRPRWSYTFQSFAYITRINTFSKILNIAKKISTPNGFAYGVYSRLFRIPIVIITERSILTDRYIFCKMLHDENSISDLEKTMYDKWYEYFSDIYESENTKMIYVRCPTNVCIQRIEKRGRLEEKSIHSEYLDSLNMYHEDWLMNNNVCIIDTTDNFIDDTKESHDILNDHLDRIKVFMMS